MEELSREKEGDAIAVAASAYVMVQLQRILVTTGEYCSHTSHIMLSLDAYDSSEDEVETYPPSDKSQRKQSPPPTAGTAPIQGRDLHMVEYLTKS